MYNTCFEFHIAFMQLSSIAFFTVLICQYSITEQYGTHKCQLMHVAIVVLITLFCRTGVLFRTRSDSFVTSGKLDHFWPLSDHCILLEVYACVIRIVWHLVWGCGNCHWVLSISCHNYCSRSHWFHAQWLPKASFLPMDANLCLKSFNYEDEHQMQPYGKVG